MEMDHLIFVENQGIMVCLYYGPRSWILGFRKPPFGLKNCIQEEELVSRNWCSRLRPLEPCTGLQISLQICITYRPHHFLSTLVSDPSVNPSSSIINSQPVGLIDFRVFLVSDPSVNPVLYWILKNTPLYCARIELEHRQCKQHIPTVMRYLKWTRPQLWKVWLSAYRHSLVIFDNTAPNASSRHFSETCCT